MSSKRIALAGAALGLAAAAAWGLSAAGRPAQAQTDAPVAIAATLRATRAEIGRDGSVTLVAGIWNIGQTAIEVELTCVPPVDFEIRNAQGIVVWRSVSPCNGDDRVLRLEPGGRREWEASWNGTYSGGAPVPAGGYTAWSALHTSPRGTGAGPVPIRVAGEGGGGEPTRPPATDGPRPTEEPRPTEVRPTEAPPVEDGPPFLAGGGDGAQRRPDVAGNWEHGECQNLVVWWNEALNAIQGRFVGREWRSEPFLISAEAGASGAPAVAYNTGRRLWLVVWPSATDNGASRLLARYVQCGDMEGGDMEGGVFGLTEGAIDDQPAVAESGRGFAVVWRRTANEGSTLQGAYLAGTSLAGQLMLEDGGSGEPAVACESREPCLVVWTQAASSGNDVIGRWWFPREETVGDVFLTIAGGTPNQREPAVAWRGGDIGHYLVSWTEGAADSVVRARGIAIADGPVGPDAYSLGTGPVTVNEGLPAAQSDVAPLGHGFVVVWSEASRGPAEIRGRRVRVVEDGTRASSVVDVSRPIIDFPPTDTYPAVAAAGSDTALVVWESRTQAPEDPGEIYGRHRTFGAAGVDRVTLEGIVTRSGSLRLSQVATVAEISVQRVLTGAFACQSARVYFDAEAWPVPLIGQRIRVVGDPPVSGEACALDVGAPGTGMVAAGINPAYAPYALKR